MSMKFKNFHCPECTAVFVWVCRGKHVNKLPVETPEKPLFCPRCGAFDCVREADYTEAS